MHLQLSEPRHVYVHVDIHHRSRVREVLFVDHAHWLEAAKRQLVALEKGVLATGVNKLIRQPPLLFLLEAIEAMHAFAQRLVHVRRRLIEQIGKSARRLAPYGCASQQEQDTGGASHGPYDLHTSQRRIGFGVI